MSHSEPLEAIKAQLEKMLVKEERSNFLRKIVYAASCLITLVSLAVTHHQLIRAINPQDVMEVAKYKMTQGIPLANQQMRQMMPGLVDQLVTSFVTETPKILQEKIVATTKPLVDETVQLLADKLAVQVKELADNQDIISPDRDTASRGYSAVFEQLGNIADEQVNKFYAESRPVLRQLIDDVQTLKDETNLTKREDLIKKILGLTLAMIEKEKMAVK